MALTPASPRITPFWQRIPQFFRYPLKPPALWLPLGIAAVVVLGMPMLWWLLQLPLILLLIFLVLTYGYESLGLTAQGAVEPPTVGDVLANGDWGLPLLQLLILLVFGSFVAIANALLGAPGVLLSLLLFSVLLPASVMVLGVERSFMAAVNPVYLWGVIRRIGWPYLGLIGLLFAQEMALGSALAVVPMVVPDAVGMAVLALVMVYFSIMYFHMLGYVMYQYHAELGHEVHGEEEDEQGGGAALAFRLALYDTLIAEQKHAAALAELQNVLEDFPDDESLHQRLLRLAAITGDGSSLAREADWLILRRLRKGQVAEAARTYLECLQAKPDYRPLAPEAFDPLARELRAGGHLRQAVQLINGFHSRFPDHALIPRVYVLAAQLFMDDLKSPGQARKILAYLQHHHPDNTYQSQVDSLVRSLDKQAQPSAGA